ncbi:unnamed protein product [Acanthoscelides obtectus]|uniref:Uncharacterized protein n=1 Tax=Acanthoscelides obtectus TaxID=200917 RepID=A0A9P0LE05_ACAOB|nr:unnamed protein product [Acanthoscelides obtectus]CAK1629780.1 hypothetical protein AOBTE_LOCUS5950 [Acanthoscelides obtectus]
MLANPKKEVEEIPATRRDYGEPVVDTGVVSFGGPYGNPFGGLFENIESVMKRMRQQMETLFRNVPGFRSNATSSEEDDGFPTLSGGFPIPAFPDLDLGKGNTTSVTKIINGHKVVINETEYSKDDDLGGAFFHVRVIDVRPEDEGKASGETSTTNTKDVEPLSGQDSRENEIPQNSREASRFQNLETFDEVDALEPFDTNELSEGHSEWQHQNSLPNHLPIDLSRDTYVNQLLAQKGAPRNPDAEVFDVRHPRDTRRYFHRRK